MDETGFTLPEVIVVTIIIAILAAIAIVTFISQREKAEQTTAVSTLRNVHLHAETLRAEAAGAEYLGDPSDYDSMGRYEFVPGTVASDGPGVVSVVATADGSQVAFASRGGERCFYLRLERAVDGRIAHAAAVNGSTTCRADEFGSGSGTGW